MDSLIKEINENLKAIISTIKDNLDNSTNTLENIQTQMDKKVEEAKKYKIDVDNAKDLIRKLEDDNKTLDISLKELTDKYSKMNLVSLIETGNREIKTKINDNLRDINKQKEHISELTNKARTIKDLLISLKKDKTVKEERLENLKVVYSYYESRINNITDYALNHSLNLSDYSSGQDSDISFEEEDVKPIDLDNTMVFDEIANIDENKNFKDEMTFINDQIDSNISYDTKVNDIINNVMINNDEDDTEDSGTKEDLDTINDDIIDEINNIDIEPVDNNMFVNDVEESNEEETDDEEESDSDTTKNIEETKEELNKEDSLNNNLNVAPVIPDVVEPLTIDPKPIDASLEKLVNVDLNKQNDDEEVDKDNEDRINKINDLFSSIDSTKTTGVPVVNQTSNIESKIDNAYKDIFGEALSENDLNKKEPTLTDIFGNPIKKEELSNETKITKNIEDIFKDNGLDFNKFKEDEKNYLKQIYNEEKFNKIIGILKNNNINLNNIYKAFNIFGEISPEDLQKLVTRFISIGQSVEAIGVILEKLPKVSKYNLEDAIIGYGDYIKDIDITELIMKAKELYKNGGNI